MNRNNLPDINELETLMGKLSVEALVMGHIRVGEYWKEDNFIPDYNKFYYILDGEGVITVGNQTYYPKPGELWLFPAGEMQSYSVLNPQKSFLKYWVHFQAKVGEINLFSLIKTPFCVNINHDRYLKGLFDQMISCYAEGKGITRQTMINTYMTQIICYYLELCGDQALAAGTSNDNLTMLAILDYIDRNLSKTLTLKDLAAEAHLQENYFVRYFKKYTGTSPMQYLNEKRMKKAAELLTTTNEKIGKIANAVGISDEVYFSRAFKKAYSLSPSDFRKYMNQ